MTEGSVFGVLHTGNPFDHLVKVYGDYGAQTCQALSRVGDDWRVFAVFRGEYPSKQDLKEIRAFVVTGSPSDAHSNDGWTPRFRDFLRELFNGGKHKLLGLCFGHQALAHALGGQSGPASESIGWEIGVKDVHFFADIPCEEGIPASSLAGQTFPLYMHHRDQVSRLPPGSQWLARSDRCEFEAFSLCGRVLSVQGHPEFSDPYSFRLCSDYARLEDNEAAKQGVQEWKSTRNEEMRVILSDWLRSPIHNIRKPLRSRL